MTQQVLQVLTQVQNVFSNKLFGDLTWQILLAEFFGTAILVIFGNGAVCNVELKGTKSGKENGKSGWILIGLGYGFAVMFPVMMFGGISAEINPAFTIGLALAADKPLSYVPFYIIAQFLGAMAGQLCLYAMYKPYYDKTEEPGRILGTFCTTEASNSTFTGFVNEFIGSFLLFFVALGVTKGSLFTNNLGLAHLSLGFLVMTLVISGGGSTGPALNPARDLGPRILHQILPIKNKGKSRWDYAWVPVVAPTLAAIVAVFVFNAFFGSTFIMTK